MSIKATRNSFRQAMDEAVPQSVGYRRDERGAALIITLLIMVILLGFVALALSRTTSENLIASNDTSEARAFEASQAGLEDATRDFATVLETKLNPNQTDLNNIKSSDVTDFTDSYIFTKTLSQVGASKTVTIQSGEFQGLYSLRDEWQINVKAQEKSSDVQVELMRRFYNNRIPLFQFGAFYNDDLELNRPPLFTFSGKVHTNSNFFVTANKPTSGTAGIYFKSKVTVHGEIINDIWKTGTTLNSVDSGNNVFFPNGSGDYKELTTGSASVKCTSATGSSILKEMDGRGRPFPYPNCTKNTGWTSFASRFEGNLVANAPELRLPVDRLGVDLIEMMRRGKNVNDKANINNILSNVTTTTQDESVLSKERYANKPGIRITLADSKDKLPQCATVTTACGVRLDDTGTINGVSGALGYQPIPMTDSSSYKTTPLNANRLAIASRQIWIKVETVDFDSESSAPVTKDITQDFLSLGVTEPFYNDGGNPASSPRLQLFGYDSNQDSRSIIKLQRFFIDGPAITTTGNYLTNTTVGSNIYTYVTRDSIGFSTVAAKKTNCVNGLQTGTIHADCVLTTKNVFGQPVVDSGSAVNSDESAHYKIMTAPSDSSLISRVVPFPIEMYDSREGDRDDSGSGVDVYRGGVMSIVDIDVYNLRRFFKGDFNDKFPTTTPYAVSNGNKGLKNTDIPEQRGWVLYFSDRRGDADFDGRYKFEDVNPDSNNLVDEDINNNGTIETDSTYTEAPRTDQKVNGGLAAVTDHGYYRRGVRLINAREIPGSYDSATPQNTQGFTFASENGIYVSGNYNVQSVTLPGGNLPAEATAYYPQDTSLHIPSSIVGDSVTILSNAWTDANSFANPWDTTKRVASNTQLRFAMISGDGLTARTAGTNGNFEGLNGGIHNFMRFLESWNSKRLNYSGSLINLYNSYNNNGRWKCCTTVYDPPIRDWTFDSSFNDPNRLPPGSPFVYYLSLTGFERINY